MALWWLFVIKFLTSHNKVSEYSVVYHIVRATLSDQLQKTANFLKQSLGPKSYR